MNPRFIFLIVVLLIIAAGVVYVLYFMPKSDETTVKGPFVLTGKASELDSEGSTIFSFSKLHQETSENFTVRVLV